MIPSPPSLIGAIITNGPEDIAASSGFHAFFPQNMLTARVFSEMGGGTLSNPFPPVRKLVKSENRRIVGPEIRFYLTACNARSRATHLVRRGLFAGKE